MKIQHDFNRIPNYIEKQLNVIIQQNYCLNFISLNKTFVNKSEQMIVIFLRLVYILQSYQNNMEDKNS